MITNLSKLWAELVAFYYGGALKLHSISQKGIWEFTVESPFYGEEPLYKSKGLRNV